MQEVCVNATICSVINVIQLRKQMHNGMPLQQPNYGLFTGKEELRREPRIVVGIVAMEARI
jgi:hypothetical protein